MASTDLLNTTLAEMYASGGNLILTTATKKPLVKNLFEKKKVNKESVGGSRFERPYTEGSPAKGINVKTGSEVAALTRANRTQKYFLESHRLFVPVAIPNIDLKRNQGKQGVIKLIKEYPLAVTETLLDDWEFWFLTGGYRDTSVSVIDTPGFDEAATLNGAVTHTLGNGGWLQLLAEASQSGTFQGVARNPTTQHVNRYGVITSFATDGMSTIGRVYDLTSQYSRGGVDLGFADTGTYANLTKYLVDNVRVANLGQEQYGKDSADYLLYKKAKVFMSVNLDPTNTAFTGTPGLSTSATTGGVLYFLSSGDIEIPYFDMLDSAPEFRDTVANQDVVSAKMYLDWQPICLRLNSMAAIAGGRIP
jgi:hypothetical protein